MQDSALADAIIGNPATAPLDRRGRAICDLAECLTLAPGDSGSSASAIAALRDHGFDDLAIHDLVLVVAYFNFVNRVASGLDVEIEPDVGVIPRPAAE